MSEILNLNIIAYFLLGVATVNIINGYVLLQVRKGGNHSDVDALIHKEVPANKFDKIADAARKHYKNYKQYKLKKQGHDDELDSIVFAIKTNDGKGGNEVKQSGIRENNKNLWNYLKNLMIDAMKTDSQPSLRSKMEKYNIKPDIIELRSGKPTMMFEIETTPVLKSLTDALKSKAARRYSDKIAKTAAYVYHVINEA